jgi:hypothetical protein
MTTAAPEDGRDLGSGQDSSAGFSARKSAENVQDWKSKEWGVWLQSSLSVIKSINLIVTDLMRVTSPTPQDSQRLSELAEQLLDIESDALEKNTDALMQQYAGDTSGVSAVGPLLGAIGVARDRIHRAQERFLQKTVAAEPLKQEQKDGWPPKEMTEAEAVLLASVADLQSLSGGFVASHSPVLADLDRFDQQVTVIESSAGSLNVLRTTLSSYAKAFEKIQSGDVGFLLEQEKRKQTLEQIIDRINRFFEDLQLLKKLISDKKEDLQFEAWKQSILTAHPAIAGLENKRRGPVSSNAAQQITQLETAIGLVDSLNPPLSSRQMAYVTQQHLEPARRRLAELKSLAEQTNRTAQQRADQRLAQQNARQEAETRRVQELRTRYQGLEYICSGNDFNITPVDWENVRSRADLDRERLRVTKAIYQVIIGRIKGSLVDKSSGLMISSEFSVAVDPKFSVSDPTKRTYALIDIFDAVPVTVTLDFGDGPETVPFMPELKGHLDTLMNVAGKIFAGANHFKQYTSEGAYIELVKSEAFARKYFDRAKLHQFLTYETAQDGLKAIGFQDGESFFPALRMVLTQLYKIGKFPTTQQELVVYDRDIKPYNCFPIEHDSQDAVIADTSKTFIWVKNAVGGSMSDDMFELVFRTAFAYIRSTGEEEFFDARPKISGHKVAKKPYAYRKATALWHTDDYARESIAVKGSARNPVSTLLARSHPALSVPMDQAWLVPVEVTPGVFQRMQVAEVIKKNLWNRVGKSSSRMPEFPVEEYQAFMNQVEVHLNFWKMGGDEKGSMLPDLHKLVKADVTNAVSQNQWLADLMAETNLEVPTVSRKRANELLRRLHLSDRAMYDPAFVKGNYNDMLYIIDTDASQQTTRTANVLKDGADYYIDKMPKSQAVVDSLFQNDYGSLMVTQFREYLVDGDSNHLSCMKMAMFYLLLRAELEQYAFEHESIHIANQQMTGSGNVFLGHNVETISRKHPLTYVQRRALEKHILTLAANLPDGLKPFALDLSGVRQLFKIVGIEGNAAADYADLKELLTTKDHPLRKAITVQSSGIFGYSSGLTRALQIASRALKGDENVK